MDDLTRLFVEMSAAATRDGARDIFHGADWIFIRLSREARELAYAKADDIIREKPE